MNNKLNLDEIFARDAERKKQKKGQHQELTLRDYLSILEKDPLIAQNSSSRILEMCLEKGTEDIPEGERWLGTEKRYNIFSRKLFGVEKPANEVMTFLMAGAAGLPIGKYILLLVGPTGSGKSTMVDILKQELEAYKIRPLYSIKGCPMHQEPLLAIPRYLRPEFEKKLGVKIKGDLCPPCRHILEEKTEDTGVVNWLDIPVETFTFSINAARGIGSFEPADDKSSDISELVGKENIGITSNPKKGHTHWNAFTLSGELEKANRGIFEGIELIKADDKLLWVFISAAEEQKLKVRGSNFPHVSIDEVLIGHTNMTEFKKFSTHQENEAFHSRTLVVAWPYTLRIKDEVALYNKLIRTESSYSDLTKCHIAPGTFEIAAIFAILTRLNESQTGLDSLTKLKVYNGSKALTELNKDNEKIPTDIRQLIEEGQGSPDLSKREGMFGVDPRDVMAALNTALVEQGQGCLTPLTAIRALRKVFDHRMGYTPEDIERFKLLLSSGEKGSVMQEYKNFVINRVSKAYLRAYEDLAKILVDNYIKEAQFYRDQKRKFVRGQTMEIPRDNLTGKPKEPNIKLLRSIEEHIPINESEADTYRGEILETLGFMKIEFEKNKSNETFSYYDNYPPLAKAAEKKLLNDSRATLTIILDPGKPRGTEENKRINDLFTELTEPSSKKEEDRHCEICAREAVDRTAEFIQE